jgi:hypothetical protein
VGAGVLSLSALDDFLGYSDGNAGAMTWAVHGPGLSGRDDPALV